MDAFNGFLLQASPVMRSVFSERDAAPGSAGAPARVMTSTQTEPAELQCDPGTGLHVVGLTPLGGTESSPTPVTFGPDQRCHYLDNVMKRMSAACNGLPHCLVDMSSIHATKDKCTGVTFVSIDVFCEPVGNSHIGSKKLTQSRLPNNFLQKSTASVNREPPAVKTVASQRQKGSTNLAQMPRRKQPKANGKSATKNELESRQKTGPKKKSRTKQDGIRVVILKNPPKKYSPKLAGHGRIPVRIHTHNESGPAITVRKVAASNRKPHVHCREAPEGLPGSFICQHRGRLPMSMLNAVRDDSYIIVTGAGPGEKKLVYIQREGRALTRDILLNILNSNDIIRKSIASETRSRESKPDIKKERYLKTVKRIKRPFKPHNASSDKLAAVKSLNDISGNAQKLEPKKIETIKIPSSPKKRKSNEKHFSKSRHHIAKRPKLLKKPGNPASVGKTKSIRPLPKKTVTLQIKLEVNEPQLPRQRSKKIGKKSNQVPVTSATGQRRLLTGQRNAAARIGHKKVDETTNVGERYFGKSRVRRSRTDHQRHPGIAEGEAFFVPAPLHIGTATSTSDNGRRLSHAVDKRPNFKLKIVSDNDSERQPMKFKEPGINAQVSLTNEDIRELFDSLNRSPDGVASRPRHRHENIGNSKPAITVSIHVGSLFARKGSILSAKRRKQHIDRLLSRVAKKRKKLWRKQSVRPAMDEIGRVTPNSHHQQLVHEITSLLPRDFDGRLNRKDIHRLIKAFNPQRQKPSSLVKLLFLLYLTKKLEAAGDGIPLSSRHRLPFNIRRQLEKAKLLPLSGPTAFEELSLEEHADFELSGSDNNLGQLNGERHEGMWSIRRNRTQEGGRGKTKSHASVFPNEKTDEFPSLKIGKQIYHMGADELSDIRKAEHSERKDSNGLKSTDEDRGLKSQDASLTQKKQMKAPLSRNKKKGKQPRKDRLPMPQVAELPKVTSIKNLVVGKMNSKPADETVLSTNPELKDGEQTKTVKPGTGVQSTKSMSLKSADKNAPKKFQKSSGKEGAPQKSKADLAKPNKLQKPGGKKQRKKLNKAGLAKPNKPQKPGGKKQRKKLNKAGLAKLNKPQKPGGKKQRKKLNKAGLAKPNKPQKPGGKKPEKQINKTDLAKPKEPHKAAGKQAPNQKSISKSKLPGRRGIAAKSAKRRPQSTKPNKPTSPKIGSRKQKVLLNRAKAAAMKSKVAPSNDDSNRLLRDASVLFAEDAAAYGSRSVIDKSAENLANGNRLLPSGGKSRNYLPSAAEATLDKQRKLVQNDVNAANESPTIYKSSRLSSHVSPLRSFGNSSLGGYKTASYDNIARRGLTSPLQARPSTVKSHAGSDGTKVVSSRTVGHPIKGGNSHSPTTLSAQKQNNSLKTRVKPFSLVNNKAKQTVNAKHTNVKAELFRIKERPILNHRTTEKERNPASAVAHSSRLLAASSKPGPASVNKPGIKPQSRDQNANSVSLKPVKIVPGSIPTPLKPVGNETITSKLIKFVKGLFSSENPNDSKPKTFATNRSALSTNVKLVHRNNQQKVNVKQPMTSTGASKIRLPASHYIAHQRTSAPAAGAKLFTVSAPLVSASSEISRFTKSVSANSRGVNTSLAALGPQLLHGVGGKPQLDTSGDHFPKLVPVNWVIALNPATSTIPQGRQESKLINLQELSEVVEHLPSEVDRCIVANPCRNFATCQTSAGGGVVCICRPGFSGPSCEVAVNPCRPNPCQNEAKCSASAAAVSTSGLALSTGDEEVTFSCLCPNGFSGRRCEVRLNPCDSRPCLNGGRCAVDDGDVTSFRCICAINFDGPHCENPLWSTVPPASSTLAGCMSSGPERCQNGGICRLSKDDGAPPRCHCQVGFLGSRCEVRAVLCTVRSPCLNGATCLQVPGDGRTTPYFRCICPQRFKGRLCDKIRNLPIVGCNRKPCSSIDSLAVCKEIWEEGGGGPGFRCTCGPGYSGDLCEVRGDPCGLVDVGRSNPCRSYGVCLPLPGDGLYRCICSNHYIGRHCDVAVVRCGSLTCLNGGLCSSSNSTTVLISSSVQLSSDSRGPEIETVTCRCPAGYTGRHCERHIDPCRSGPCLNGGLCRPADNREGFSCICAEPFFGRYCEMIPNGSSSGGSGRKNMINSVETNHGLTSKQSKAETLIVDMRGDGDCVFSDYCLNGGSCFRTTAGRWVCVCLRGFGGDRCENSRDSCSSRPCLNGASCYNSPSGVYRCVCPTGFTGWRCDVGPEICAGSSPPCQNNGACRPARNTVGYECICPPGFGGLACELRDPCLDRPCRNGAECTILPSTDVRPKSDNLPSSLSLFQCRCPAGFSGQLCEVDGTAHLDASQRTACSSVPCRLGATCRPSASADGFVCVCPPGVKGKRCERDSKNDCRRSPCRNGGVCFDRPGGFECSCPDGFRGITCEVKLFSDPCDRRPCSNGGKCKMISTESFVCRCPTLFSGLYCTDRRKVCSPNEAELTDPCPDDHICTEDPTDFDKGYICVDKSLQSSFGDYKWKFIDSVNGASVNDNDDDIRHIQDEDVSRKKKLSGNLEDTKAKKDVIVDERTSKPVSLRGVTAFGIMLSASLLTFIILFFIIWDRFRPPVDDYGFGSYQQLPTSGSTPAASRSQTPQPPHAGRDPPELGNFQQSNSLVDFDDDSKESFIPATRPIVAPLPPMLLSTLAELRSRFVTKRKTSSAASFSPPPRSHIGNRQLVLPSIPEETAVDVSNSNDSSAARRTDQFGIDSACLDSSCEVLQQQQHHRCCDAAGRSIDDGDDGANAPASVPDQSSSDIELGGCGSCGSGTASSDELSSSSSSSSRKSCNANNSSAANRNNSSATSFSRRDAVLARLSQAAASWTSRFRFAPQPPQVLDTESRVKPATFVPSSSFILQEPQQQQTPPVDDDGFQTVELFSVSDDIPGPNQRPQPNHQHQMPESRRHRVGPFNYVAGGSR